MINYIKAEIYRILLKKSLYFFLFALIAAFAIMMVIQYGGRVPLSSSNIVMQGRTLFSLTGILGGCFLFMGVYTDDLGAKTLPAAIGFGRKRSEIVMSKLVIMALFTVTMFLLAMLAFWGLFSAMGYAAGGEVTGEMWKEVLGKSLMVVAFAVVSSVAVYGTQKTALSVVLFALLSTGFISQLLINFLDSSLMSGIAVGLSDYTVIPIITKLVSDTAVATVIPYIIYLALFVALSIFAFNRKELEF